MKGNKVSWVKYFVFTCILLLLGSCAERITETPLAWHLGQTGKIPSGYKTYTLFLKTSYDYTNDTPSDKLRVLEKSFKVFGDSIGDDNIAVWVDKGENSALSVSRGKYYADLFSRYSGKSIEYSDGPFLILSGRHPEELSRLKSNGKNEENATIIVIGFRNISSKRMIEILNYLEARIRRDELNTTKTSLYTLWVSMKSWWDETDKEFLKEVTLSLISRMN